MKKIATTFLASMFFVLTFSVLGGLVPMTATAQVDIGNDTKTSNTAPNISFALKNPLGGTTTLESFLANLLDAIVLLLTPVIVIMLLYSGFLFVTAQGKAEELSKAKNALVYTLIGAAVVLGAKGLAEVVKNTVSCLATSGSC